MRKNTLALLATPLVLLTLACGTGQAGSDNGSTAPSTTKSTPNPESTPAAKAAPKTLLTAHGSGIKNTAKFTTGDDWNLQWTYDCAGSGFGKGNFIVTVYTDGDLDDIVVNELGKKGSSTSPVYDDPGTHYLSVNSVCSWTLKVTTP